MRKHTHHSLASQTFSSREARLCHLEGNPDDIKVSDIGSAEKWGKAKDAVWEKTKDAADAVWNFNISGAGRWTKEQVMQAPKNIQSIWRWISNNPSLQEQERVNMISSLQEFMIAAPSPIVQLVADAVEETAISPVTPEQLQVLMDHTKWIEAFNSNALTEPKPSQNFFLNNDAVHRTPFWLLQTLDVAKRRAVFEQYVNGFVSPKVKEKHADLFGEATDKPQEKSDALFKNRAQILGAMNAMLGGELPADDQKNGNPSKILAFDALEDRYNADKGFISPELRYDAARAKKNPNAPSFFAGANKLKVLDPKVLQVIETDLQRKQEKTDLNIAEVRDGLTQLDAKTKLREATTILNRMEPWEKLVIAGVLLYGAIKFPKAAIIAVGTYLTVKYVGGVQDPLGAGLKKVKEGWDYAMGKGEDVKGSVGWNHEKDPAKVAEIMTHFIEGEDQQNVVEEAKVLAVLNAKSMSELSRAYVTDGKGFTLNLDLLFGERKNIPPYLKQEDHCRAMTQAVGYLLFSHYRASPAGLADPNVKTISSRMAKLPPGKSWADELRQNPQLNSMYNTLILKGKSSASGDSRQLHQFVLEQVGTVDTASQSKTFEKENAFFESKKTDLLDYLNKTQNLQFLRKQFTIVREGPNVRFGIPGSLASTSMENFLKVGEQEFFNKYKVWKANVENKRPASLDALRP